MRVEWLPNLLTGARLASLPLLWLLALRGWTEALAIGVAIAVSTDVLDGTLARVFDARSEFGSRLDSVADHLLTGSVVIWVAMLRPEFVGRNGAVLMIWAALGATTLAVGWLRFRRIGDLHLYSGKIAMTLGYVFVILLLYKGTYDRRFFGVAMGACFVATGEALFVYLTREEGWERIGSALQRGRKRPSGSREPPGDSGFDSRSRT